MPKSTTEVTLTDFEGVATGLTARFKDTEFQQADNFWITPNKTLRVRNGFNTHGTVQSYDNAEILGKFSTGNDYIIVTHDDGLDPVFISNGNTLGTGFIDPDPADLMLVANSVAYFFDDGSGANRNVRTWAGGAVTDTGQSQKANLGVTHKNRFFVCNNITTGVAKSQLRYTDIFDLNLPSTALGWSEGGTISVNTSDNDFITAVCVMNDTLFIFKRYSSWVLYTDGVDTSWTLRNIHPTIGCVGRDTVAVIGGLLYFLSGQGLYRTDGTTFERLSDKVSDWFDSLTVTAAQCNLRSAAWYENLYVLNINNSSWLNIYHIDNGGWTQWDVSDNPLSRLISVPEFSPWAIMSWFQGTAECLALYHSDTLFGDRRPGGGATISYYTPEITTKGFDFDKPLDVKQVIEVVLDISSATSVDDSLSYLWVTEGNTSSTVTNVFYLRNSTLVRLGINNRCRKIYLNFYTGCQPYEINSISFVLNLRGRAKAT